MAQSTSNAPRRICAGLFMLDHQDGGSRNLEVAVPVGPAAPTKRLGRPVDSAAAREPRPVVIEGRLPTRGGCRTAAATDNLVVNAQPAPGDVVGLDSAGPQVRGVGLTGSDAINLSSLLGHQIAETTRATYRSQWRNFAAWAQSKSLQALPADPVQVAAYLAERLETYGHRPATLRVAAAAIAFVHRAARLDDPCARQEVKVTLKSATRKAGRSQKQAEALTADALAIIEANVRKPRLGRGGRLESSLTATRRGNVDIALICLMRDALLRVSEAAALTWSDIDIEADGTGRLLIRRSKTDTEGEGAIAFVSASTMTKLKMIQTASQQTDSIFELRPNQIALRIKKAAQTAGLGDGFSGHSPRVGMARDLARAGIELPSLMTAGRWSTASMPARYIRNETAGRGAVAQYYASWHWPA